MPDPSAASADNANGLRYLLYDRQVRVRRDTVESYSRWSSQITNETGLATRSQVKIEFDPSYETLLLHHVNIHRGRDTLQRLTPEAVKLVQREPNLEAQVFDGRQSAVLFVSDLRVGDVIDYAYTLRGNDPTLGEHYVDSFALAAPEPIARIHARIDADPSWSPQLRLHASDADRKLITSIGRYEWDLRDVPAHAADPAVPAWYPTLPWEQITDFKSWSEVAEWGTRLFRADLPRDGPLRDWVTTARAKTTSPQELLLDAIRFVQDEVRYLGIETGMGRRVPTPPTKVFERRYGDCKDKTMLLVALLRLAQITAQPALVSTTHGHVLDQLGPSPDVFNHAIVRVSLGGRTYWVDPTIALQGGGLDRLAYSPYENALVLDGHSGGLERLTAAPAERPSPAVTERFQVGDPTTTTETLLDVERSYEGTLADFMRAKLRAEPAVETSKRYLALYQGVFPKLREVTPPERHDDRASNVVRVVAHYAIPDFWRFEPQTQRWIAEVSARQVADLLERPPTTAERFSPLALTYPMHVRQTLELQLPFPLSSTPEHVTEGEDTFQLRFDSNIRDAPSGALVSYVFDLENRAYEVPATGVLAHLEQVDKARAHLVRSVTYRAPIPDGLNWIVLLVLVGCLPFAGWGAVRAHRYEPRRLSPPIPVAPDPRLVGLGGWLILLGLSLVFTPIVNVVSLVTVGRSILSLRQWRALTSPELTTYAPGVAIASVLEVLASLFIVTYGIVVLVLFFQKRRGFPFHFTIYAAALASVATLDHLAAVAMSPGRPADLQFGRSLVWAAIWIAYVHRSRRVALTFVERAPRRQRSSSSRKKRAISS